MAAFGVAGAAQANKGIDKVKHDHFTSGFSAPFVADNDAEVSHSDGFGSKGDLDNDGNWGVTTGELPGFLASGFVGDEDSVFYLLEADCLIGGDGEQTCAAVDAASFDICVVGTGAEVLLATVGGTGATDNLDIDATEADGGVALAGDYQQPSLRIREADASACTGTLLQESGTTVVID